MTPISAAASAAQGYTRGVELANLAGRQVLAAVAPDAGKAGAARGPGAAVSAAAARPDLVSGVTGLVQAKAQTSAAAALARTANEMTGALLDIMA